MKKIFIVMFVVAMAAACGKKAAQPAAPKPADDMGSAAPATPPEGEGTPEAKPEEAPAPSE
jgi:hypothetical protein